MNSPAQTRREGLTHTTLIAGVVLAGLCAAFWLVEAQNGGKGTILATSAQAKDMLPAIHAPDVHAGADEPAEETEETTQTATTDEGDHADHQAQPQGPVFQDNPMVSLSGALREKQQELEKRETAVAAREKQLLVLQAELEETLKKTQAMRDEMNRLAGAAETKRKKELGKWIDVYQTMKAPEAAQMLSELDEDFALELLASMDVKKSSKILSEMVKTNKPKSTALALRLEAQNK